MYLIVHMLRTGYEWFYWCKR